MDTSKQLLKFVECESELNKNIENVDLQIEHLFKKCINVIKEVNLQIDSNYLFYIDLILDYLHDWLNTGHWSKVPINFRQAFTTASFIKAVILQKLDEKNIELSLKCVDLGLLLGAPLDKNSELLLKSASYLSQRLNKSNNENSVPGSSKKRKLSVGNDIITYKNIPVQEINTESCPSIDTFNTVYFQPQLPVKITDSINHWPAMVKWKDINYLLSVAGNRTVPIEIGSNYADKNWGQKLMTLQEFIQKHFLVETSSDEIGYLAQHNLFDQISELRNDISIPDYCCLSKNYNNSFEPDINAWFGPSNTVSPLHFDPKNNLLTQVFGTKQVILFSPNDSTNLYPYDDMLLNNTSQVNPLKPDLEKYPLFESAKMFKCLLQPGEMLFIPEKWWHHVTALDRSFSVSFWWE